MWKYLIKKYWFAILVAPIFMCGEVIADLLQPHFMSVIIDDGVLGLSNNYEGSLTLVVHTGIQMITLVILGVISAIISGIFAHSCGQKFGNDIRKRCFHQIMSMSFGQIESFGESSLVTRIMSDISQVQQLVRMSISAFIRTFVLFVGGIICMMILDWHFGLIVLAVLPVILGLIIFFLRKSNAMFLVLQKKIDVINRIVQENLYGVRVVKAFVKENYEIKRFSDANDSLVETQLAALQIFAVLTPLMNMVLNIAVVLIIWIGGIQVQAGSITPGKVVAAITYITQILNAVLSLNMIFQTISRGNACAKRIQEILDCKPDITDGNGESENNTTHGKIEFQNVCFAYPDTSEGLILENINLEIQPGQTVGILGTTGSGKSTLVKLIPRFWDVSSGALLVDNRNVKSYSLKELRNKISIVFQKSEIFSDSFENNILWGNRDADFEQVEEAARDAQAFEFIMDKEDGFQTQISQNGTSLSGGQKQRVAISRGMIKQSDILILDDSTSALDLKTESDLFQSIHTKYPKLTKIIIAQRVSSVKNADCVVVMDEGKIVAKGTHDELLKSSTIYRDIYDSQFQCGGFANGN